MINPLCVLSDIVYSPIYLVVYAPGGKGFSSVRIMNPTKEPIRIQLKFLNWEYTKDGQVKILKDKKGEKTLSNYLKVSPKQFTLPPEETRMVRIAAKLPATYEDNVEYRLLFNMKEIGADRKILNAGKDLPSYGLTINKAMNAGVYIRKGREENFKKEMVYEDFVAGKRDQNVEFKFKYNNLGNCHARRRIGARIYNMNEELIFEKSSISSFVSFPNTPLEAYGKFEFPTDKLDPEQKYKVELVIQDSSIEALKGKSDADYISPKFEIYDSPIELPDYIKTVTGEPTENK